MRPGPQGGGGGGEAPGRNRRLRESDYADVVIFQLGPNLDFVGRDHDCRSRLIVACSRKSPQPVIDGIADGQADSQRQATNHQQTSSVHSSPLGTTPDPLIYGSDLVSASVMHFSSYRSIPGTSAT